MMMRFIGAESMASHILDNWGSFGQALLAGVMFPSSVDDVDTG
jgi:hypothetical protein